MAKRRFDPKQLERSTDLAGALDALDSKELRAFVLEMLDGLDTSIRRPIEDALLRRAATRGSYRPAAPSPKIVDEVAEFVAAAIRVGYAEPSEVDDYLRRGVTASLAGEHATAKRVFGSLLLPIAAAEIDLGQHEMVEEVLSVDLHDCVGRYLLAIFFEASPESRVDAIFFATEKVEGLSALIEPVHAMEQAFGRALPHVDLFLDGWIKRLDSTKQREDDWESEHDRWLRDAVGRREGTAGLARIARTMKKPEAVRAWCNALVEEGDWKAALAAYDEAAELVSSDIWHGEFLDGAALAASRLGRKDATKRLEAAWLGVPSLVRLLRWLVADDASAATIRKRGAATLDALPAKSSRLLSFLHMVIGDVPSAAPVLRSASGLGWSSDDHPGHLLFPLFAWVLANGAPHAVTGGLIAALEVAPTSHLEWDSGATNPSASLPVPTILELFARAEVRSRVTTADRAIMLEALKTAASKRSDGVTSEKRRRHYDHAAKLVACCVEIEGAASAGWLSGVRGRTGRFPAFQGALGRALAGGKTFTSTRSIADGE